MIERKKIVLFIGICTLLIGLTGCSSGSFTPRYGEKKKHIKEVAKEQNTNSDTLFTLEELPDSLLDYYDNYDDEEYIGTNLSRDSILAFLNKETSGVEITERDRIIFEVIKYLDTPYRYGGTTDKGLDCSAFTGAVYRNSLQINLPRSSADQYGVGEKLKSQDELKFGDLVFFKTRRRARVSHVGIYLGERLFAHASTSRGVIVSSLDETYYKKRYVGARRIIRDNYIVK
jgi:cell wall-associated NlpC family hydrolase